ncbi:MAG: TetR/AcrR family transcriptional regulator [Bdellovibrionales bacterium]|nr:TetR/AcrR family transcriptional regulator [Bdellovibrionales bacterium]
MKETNRIISQRKLPKQARSKSMVENILEATIRILDTSAEPNVTTTSIASRAGISVGSLYQYFPNKHSIVAALIHWHSKDSIEKLIKVLNSQNPKTLEQVVNILVRYAVEYHLDRKFIYRYMNKFLISLNCEHHVAEARNRAVDIINQYCRDKEIAIHHQDRRQAIYLSTIAVMGLIDYTIIFDDRSLSGEELCHQAQLLVKQYI